MPAYTPFTAYTPPSTNTRAAPALLLPIANSATGLPAAISATATASSPFTPSSSKRSTVRETSSLETISCTASSARCTASALARLPLPKSHRSPSPRFSVTGCGPLTTISSIFPKSTLANETRDIPRSTGRCCRDIHIATKPTNRANDNTVFNFMTANLQRYAGTPVLASTPAY